MTKVIFFLISILFLPNEIGASKSDLLSIKWSFTPDFNYTINDILNKKDVLFLKNDSIIYPQKNRFYWAQIIVKSNNNQRYYLSAIPDINNVWFYQQNDGQWMSRSLGKKNFSGRRDHRLLTSGSHRDEEIFYVHLDVSDLYAIKSFKPSIKGWLQEVVDQQEWYITLFSFLSIIILFMYIVNNLVEYFFLRENTHIYYIIGLTGGLLYVLSYHSVIEKWISYRYIKVLAASEHQLYIADFSYILNRISIITIFFSLIQLASNFLNTQKHIPNWHSISQKFLIFYISFNFISLICTIFTPFPADLYIITFSNIMLIAALVLGITSGIICLKKDRENAKLFLSAHLIPFFFILLTTLYVELNYFTSYSSVIMPYLTILSIPIGLNTLLTLRVIHIRNSLHEIALSTQKLYLENEKTKHDKERAFFEKEHLKTQLEVEKLNKENLELKINLQDRQLLTSTLQIQKKNEIIHQISKEVSKIPRKDEHYASSSLKEIFSLMQNHENAENNWAIFKEHFEKIHPQYLESLKKNYPQLTTNDVRLSAYIKLNLTNKEIAVLQNIEPASVKKAKIRLKQKLNKE